MKPLRPLAAALIALALLILTPVPALGEPPTPDATQQSPAPTPTPTSGKRKASPRDSWIYRDVAQPRALVKGSPVLEDPAIIGLRFEYTSVVGEIFRSQKLTLAQNHDQVVAEYGAEPRIYGVYLTGEPSAATASWLKSSDTPMPAPRNSRAATFKDFPNTPTEHPSSTGEYWEPTRTSTSARELNPNTAAFQIEAVWDNGHRPSYPNSDKGGLELEVSMRDPHGSGRRFTKSQCISNFWANFSTSAQWWGMETGAGKNLRGTNAQPYFDDASFYDDCDKFSIALGIGWPKYVPESEPGVITVRARANVDRTSLPMSHAFGFIDAVSNDCGGTVTASCMGLSDNQAPISSNIFSEANQYYVPGCVTHIGGPSDPPLFYPNCSASPIARDFHPLYMQLGAHLGALGTPTSSKFCGLRDGGCAQRFEGGLIYTSPSGTHPVFGAIGQAYEAQGWENGPLGYPTSGEFILRDGGRGQRFEHGLIYWTPRTGAQVVRGAILQAYAANRWENGPLGYPIGNEFCGLRDGGCAQHFEHGLIYWSPNSGSYSVHGAILDKYAEQRWETGRLGYPLGEEFCGLRNGGCGQHFQGGSIYWSPQTGAHTMWGAFRDEWAFRGWENSGYGYPTTDEYTDNKGHILQDFEFGWMELGPSGVIGEWRDGTRSAQANRPWPEEELRQARARHDHASPTRQ